MPKQTKSNKGLIITICVTVAVIVVAIVAVLLINNSQPKKEYISPQEFQQQNEDNLIIAKLDQVKAYAEIYKTENGKYPSALADFIKNPDFLAGYDVVYEQTNGGDGFILTYTANDGTKITRTNN